MIKNRNLDPRENKKNIEIALTGGLANAISFAWENPEKDPIAITRALLLVTTAGGTGGATIDVGVTNSATGTDDAIFNGIGINATGLSDNMGGALYDTFTEARAIYVDANTGTNKWITGKILVQNASKLVGKIYLEYKVL